MRHAAHGSPAVGLILAIAVLLGSALPGDAGGRVFVGIGVGAPFWYPYPYPYAYPYPYGYPYPAYSPPAVVEQPPVYVQPEAPAPAQYWYYCRGSEAYYPYVKECPGGWMEVVPQAGPTTVQPPGTPR